MRMEEEGTALLSLFESINGHSPYFVHSRDLPNGKEGIDRYTDQAIWRLLSRLANLEKYMLCTSWEALQKEIEDFRAPVFTIENGTAWLEGLNEQIRGEVITLVQKVYDEVVNGTYLVGSGYNAPKKKRNNAGIDSFFILRTNDYQSMYSYWRSGPTVTDDLEKACYVLDGKQLPDKPLKVLMKGNGETTGCNDYFSVRFAKNGNTSYKLTDDTREKLNKYGPRGAAIGEAVKIKVFS